MAIHHLLSYSFFLLAFFSLSCLPSLDSLSTVSISHASNQTLICALIHSSDQQSYLNCTSFPQGIQIPPTSGNTSFSGIVGGNGFLCALSLPSSPSYMVCWRFSSNGTDMSYKRIYLGPALKELDAGNSHVCGLADGTDKLECWQWPDLVLNGTEFASSVAVGDGFVCGLSELGQIRCLGSYGNVIDHVPRGNYRLVASGSRHACATSSLNGSLECWGDMVGEKPAGEFKALALGENRSCAMRPNGKVTCWGEDGFALPGNLRDAFFEAIEGNGNVFCGILASDLSLNCWGNEILDSNSSVMKNVLPGPCRSECSCGPLPNYGTFCSQGLMICEPCKGSTLVISPPSIPSQPPTSPPSRRTRWNRKMIAFLVVGCVGSLSFLIASGFLFSRYCKVRGYRVHDSGPLDDPLPPLRQGGPSQTSQVEQAKPTLEKRLSQLTSLGNGGHLEEFSLQMLLHATRNFSEERKIGSGSFGSVYHGTLDDGREVAIKRAEFNGSNYAFWCVHFEIFSARKGIWVNIHGAGIKPPAEDEYLDQPWPEN
ncbi:hypothetical protein RJ639_046969 [Escallonia herrerae]|uniref:non-specific serine/threonine protein kinase n=1 Tax=Escallonia herrerae TaxID=1293975 RepID=A0AA88W7Z1_9ASTE|nr:hypothetical protein RJ639_046969 [Escallonia herrerae]